ncbi:MAG: Holliday junction resolvase RuvX [Bacteroidota bacterium]|nr:Holliday junction resolvase RuvX [Bacteroidota bacterium]
MDNTRYLALDYGHKRVGTAVSDESKTFSFSREYILNEKDLLSRLLVIIQNENIEKIIIGHPLNLNSQKTIQTEAVEDFKSKLEEFLKKKSLSIEIILFDERFTSKIAECCIRNSGLSKQRKHEKGLIDSASAQIILQDYIDSEKIKSNNK